VVDDDGYGARPGQDRIERLLEDSRTLSPLGVERAAQGWEQHAGFGKHQAWIDAERAALHVVETTGRTSEWEALRRRIVGMTEGQNALIAWKVEHGDTGHKALEALLGAALALVGGDDLDRGHAAVLRAPMAEALPWLAVNRVA
jgi:hypothetical protein